MAVTPTQPRQLALALPESEEKSHFEQPDFRVRNKIFAGLKRAAAPAPAKKDAPKKRPRKSHRS
jgi:hypothetical protein